MNRDVKLRSAREDDNQFLLEIFSSDRRAELAGLGWSRAQQDSFLKMQFEARRRSYASEYPGAPPSIVLVDGEAAGCLQVARDVDAITLVDIAIMPEFRGGGVGTRLVSEVVCEGDGAGLPVRLAVARGNPAAHLYRRLGFVETGEDGAGVYVRMERPRRAPADDQAAR